MAMATTVTTKNTKTMEELAAAASALEKDAEYIADLVVLLTRDLLLRWDVEVDVNKFYVDREEEGVGGEVEDEDYNNDGYNGINNNDNALETRSLLSSSLPPSLQAADIITKEEEEAEAEAEVAAEAEVEA